MKYVGIDIGGMSVKCGVVEDGVILVKKSAPIKAQAEDTVILQEIATLVDKTLLAGNFDKKDIAGIGIGCPGSIDDEAGEVRYC
ncbi:MAG: ROK family protein, partial [Clostridia bacterium]|nr:ROK family protein [Clostridia bacterium]